MTRIDIYTIDKDATILDALVKIDENKKGFLILIYQDMSVFGVITDGDIRRALIRGAKLNDSIEKYCNRNYHSLHTDNIIEDAIEIFKSFNINFLPILDNKEHLVNILTKLQLHTLLLKDLHMDIMDNFEILDENVVDYEIFERPWGFYKTTVMNDFFQSKIISIKPGGSLSLQSHNRREEYWIIAHGEGLAQMDQSITYVRPGSVMFIPKGCKHRLTNTKSDENLILTEVQLGDYFGEDDIIRYEDKYGRV